MFFDLEKLGGDYCISKLPILRGDSSKYMNKPMVYGVILISDLPLDLAAGAMFGLGI